MTDSTTSFQKARIRKLDVLRAALRSGGEVPRSDSGRAAARGWSEGCGKTLIRAFCIEYAPLRRTVRLQVLNGRSHHPASAGSCEKIRPVGAPGLQQPRNPLHVIGGGVPSRRVLHKFRIFSQLPEEGSNNVQSRRESSAQESGTSGFPLSQE